MSLGSDKTENNLDNICWNWYILYKDGSLLINNEFLIVVMRVSRFLGSTGTPYSHESKELQKMQKNASL